MADPQKLRAELLSAISRCRPGPGASELDALCRDIGQSLDLRWCAIELADGAGRFSWSLDSAAQTRAAGERGFPVAIGGQLVGMFHVQTSAVRRIGASRRRLLREAVDALGAPLLAVHLYRQWAAQVAAARGHAERIAAARRQAFAERDAERRALERDLHDGAQHHLVALRMAVGLLELQLADGDLSTAAAGLQTLGERVVQAEHVLLTTAAGICPPVLVDMGLAEALNGEFAHAPAPVELVVSADVAGRRFPLAVEIAVYFTCLEAVNNAHKHAQSARVVVRLGSTAQGLSFSVSDDGPGLIGPDVRSSSGLDNMRARLVSAGGQLTLSTGTETGRRRGTTVEGFIPI